MNAPPPALQVLLVDDEADSAELLQLLLETRGFAVTTARSIASALAAAETAAFDVIVSDIGLPDGSGCDLLRELRAASAVPAIALSGRDSPADVAIAREAGFEEYLGKPVTIGELVDALGRVSARRLR
jgi:DNA-binding response OmpR family regulator